MGLRARVSFRFGEYLDDVCECCCNVVEYKGLDVQLMMCQIVNLYLPLFRRMSSLKEILFIILGWLNEHHTRATQSAIGIV